jgi:hypothetical protein
MQPPPLVAVYPLLGLRHRIPQTYHQSCHECQFADQVLQGTLPQASRTLTPTPHQRSLVLVKKHVRSGD